MGFLGKINPKYLKSPNNLNNPMLIGGLEKFSLLDYPGKISAIVFTQGCNFRCGFCHNPILVLPGRFTAAESEPAQAESLAGEDGKLKYSAGQAPERQKVHPLISEDELFIFLKSRAEKLDAVVITGGEPCLHHDLPEFMGKIKKLGFLIKLDTNGSYPEMLAKLLSEKLIDYLAMDLKGPWEKYEKIIAVKTNLNKIKESVRIIMSSGQPYEFRTTIVPGLAGKDDISKMGEIIKGANQWYLQAFKSNINLVDKSLEGRAGYGLREMEKLAEIGRKYVKRCEVR